MFGHSAYSFVWIWHHNTCGELLGGGDIRRITFLRAAFNCSVLISSHRHICRSIIMEGYARRVVARVFHGNIQPHFHDAKLADQIQGKLCTHCHHNLFSYSLRRDNMDKIFGLCPSPVSPKTDASWSSLLYNHESIAISLASGCREDRREEACRIEIINYSLIGTSVRHHS